MKKILFAIMAIVISTSAFAQGPQGPQGGQRREFNPQELAKRQATRVQEATGASAEQYDALYAFYLRQMQQRPAQGERKQMEPGQRPSEEEMQARRAEMEKRRQAQDDSLRVILTPEQFEKYQAAQEEWRQRGPQGGQRQQVSAKDEQQADTTTTTKKTKKSRRAKKNKE